MREPIEFTHAKIELKIIALLSHQVMPRYGRLKISTNATPVPLFFPRRTAV